MSVRQGSLTRTTRSLRISNPIALDKRRAMLGYDALQEIEQQFQVPISGTASAGVGFASTTVAFDVDFFDAPEQRDSALAVPQFTFGAVLDADVMVSAIVKAWVIDSRGAITGATVSIGVCRPGQTDNLPYNGHVALCFQGFGALTENAEALDVGT